MNSPQSFIDLSGNDAIWVTDNNGGWGFGHSSLLIQDSNGDWYHVNFGPNADTTNPVDAIFSVNPVELPDNITFDGRTFTNSRTEYTAKEIGANTGIPTGLERYFDESNDFYHYIEGDFTASLEKALQYVNNQPTYNLFGNNCAWIALEILMVSYDEDSEIYRRIYNELWMTTTYLMRTGIFTWGYLYTLKHRRSIFPNSFNDTILQIFNNDIC